MTREDTKSSRGRPPSLTLEQYHRILEVKKARQQIPSNKALAQELGVKVSLVEQILSKGLKTYREQI